MFVHELDSNWVNFFFTNNYFCFLHWHTNNSAILVIKMFFNTFVFRHVSFVERLLYILYKEKTSRLLTGFCSFWKCYDLFGLNVYNKIFTIITKLVKKNYKKHNPIIIFYQKNISDKISLLKLFGSARKAILDFLMVGF